MRMSNDTLRVLHGTIAPLDTPERRARYRAGDFSRADRVKDLDQRYRWDLLWLGYADRLDSTRWDLFAAFDAEGLDDSHIDTALRALVRPLSDD